MGFNPWEIHHLYIGLLMMLAGWLLRNKRPWLGYILFVAGGTAVADDIWQHFIAGWSFLNLAFHWLWSHTLGLFMNWPLGNL
jgi:hypothetical protein